MSKISFKPGTFLYPLPVVMVSCGDMEKSNIITVAWTGILNTDPPMTYISVRKERFSHDILKEKGEYVINLVCDKLVFNTDYCGVKSGNDIDKFAEMNLTREKAQIVQAPLIKESPVNIECKVRQVMELGSHDMFISDIVNVNVDESYMDENGKFDLEKCGLIAYSHGQYYKLGENLGKFGFSVKKK